MLLTTADIGSMILRIAWATFRDLGMALPQSATRIRRAPGASGRGRSALNGCGLRSVRQPIAMTLFTQPGSVIS